jgi:pyruvate kinase
MRIMNRGLGRHLGTAAGLACLAIAVAAPASADTLNTTTCSQQQIMASLQQNTPIIWGRISSDPQTEQKLRAALDVLLAIPPGQREQAANTLEQALGKDQLTDISDDVINASGGPIGRAVNACHNF